MTLGSHVSFLHRLHVEDIRAFNIRDVNIRDLEMTHTSHLGRKDINAVLSTMHIYLYPWPTNNRLNAMGEFNFCDFEMTSFKVIHGQRSLRILTVRYHFSMMCAIVTIATNHECYRRQTQTDSQPESTMPILCHAVAMNEAAAY